MESRFTYATRHSKANSCQASFRLTLSNSTLSISPFVYQLVQYCVGDFLLFFFFFFASAHFVFCSDRYDCVFFFSWNNFRQFKLHRKCSLHLSLLLCAGFSFMLISQVSPSLRAQSRPASLSLSNCLPSPPPLALYSDLALFTVWFYRSTDNLPWARHARMNVSVCARTWIPIILLLLSLCDYDGLS